MKVNFEKQNDLELYYLMKSGNDTAQRAFAELYARHSGRVYAYCHRFLGNRADAQDLFQETFVRFYESAREEREMTNISGFIIKIARNLCVNSKRQEKRHGSLEDIIDIETDRHDKDELLNLIESAMEILRDDYRELFVLREYNGLSYKDIADITGMAIGAVRIKLFRAKKKLREILAPYLTDMYKNNI